LVLKNTIAKQFIQTKLSNLDAFLKQFEIAVRKLQNLVVQIQDMKEKEIIDIIQDIDKKILFDKELAFSKRWVHIN
jgi:hypothetical protein